MQTKCLRLMGKKLLVALTLEGKFAAEGLHDMDDEDDDILAALARELVEKDGVGETADAIWSLLRERHRLHYSVQETMPSEPAPKLEAVHSVIARGAVQLSLF